MDEEDQLEIKGRSVDFKYCISDSKNISFDESSVHEFTSG